MPWSVLYPGVLPLAGHLASGLGATEASPCAPTLEHGAEAPLSEAKQGWEAEGASGEGNNGKAALGPAADKPLITCRQPSSPATSCWRNAKLPPALPPALNPCPLLARVQPTNLECHLSERFLPGWCEDLSCVSPGKLGENPGSSSWSQSLPASWTETLNATAELEHEAAQEKRVGLVAMQVSTAPLRGPHIGASQPPARLCYRHGHSRKWGLVTHTGWWAESDRQAGSSPSSRRRRQQVGPLRPVLTQSVLEADRPRLLLVVWSS